MKNKIKELFENLVTILLSVDIGIMWISLVVTFIIVPLEFHDFKIWLKTLLITIGIWGINIVGYYIYFKYTDWKLKQNEILKGKRELKLEKLKEKYQDILKIVSKCTEDIFRSYSSSNINYSAYYLKDVSDYLLYYDSYLSSLQSENSQEEIDIFTKAACLFYSILYNHVFNVTQPVSGLNDGVRLSVSASHYELTLNMELAMNCALELIGLDTSSLEKNISSKIWFDGKRDEELFKFCMEYGGIIVQKNPRYRTLDMFYQECLNKKKADILTLSTLLNLIYLHCQDTNHEAWASRVGIFANTYSFFLIFLQNITKNTKKCDILI